MTFKKSEVVIKTLFSSHCKILTWKHDDSMNFLLFFSIYDVNKILRNNCWKLRRSKKFSFQGLNLFLFVTKSAQK